MLTVQEVEGLEEGDVVETYPLFPGLTTTEPVKLRVVEVKKARVEFVASWFGIALGRWAATISNDKVQWAF